MSKEIFSGKEINKLILDDFSADVALTVEQRDDIVIDAEGKKGIQYDIAVSENTLKISKIKKGFFNFSFFDSQDYDIAIPRGMKVYISLMSGDIDIDGIGDPQKLDVELLDIKQTSGDINVENLSGGNFMYSSSSSDINLSETLFDKIKLKVISSDVSIDATGCNTLEVTGISGDIDVDLISSFKSIYCDVKSGDINLELPVKEIAAELKSLSGSVDLDGVMVVSDAGAPKVSIHTLSGDISVEGKRQAEAVVIKAAAGENEPVSMYAETAKKEDKEKILEMLLEGKIAEKDGFEILKGFGFSSDDIDAIFEEYLFRKVSQQGREEGERSDQ